MRAALFGRASPRTAGGRRSRVGGWGRPHETIRRGCPRPSCAALRAGRVIPLPRLLVFRCASALRPVTCGPLGFWSGPAALGRKSPPTPITWEWKSRIMSSPSSVSNPSPSLLTRHGAFLASPSSHPVAVQQRTNFPYS
jgi:hypothetical protein